MDGGGLAWDGDGRMLTVWRREMSIFISRPGEPETKIGEGRAPMIATGRAGAYVVWQDGQNVVLKKLGAEGVDTIGPGRLPHIVMARSGTPVVAFERSGTIYSVKR